MELQLSTTQDMSKAIESIDGFTQYLTEQCEENPDKVFVFTNKLRKAIDEVEKHAKQGAIQRQETYWELSGGYSLRLTQKASYDFSYSPEWLLAKAQLKEVEETLKLEIDLKHKKFLREYNKMSEVYTLVTPK
jgi:hypothetical protein